ncbi:hypothetical protein FB192DRAFT_1050919 [Mucor lusitanicus]|uniref:Uncharacterized protein n=1 Tax=Mucor circinelloides f. lusitanicus TaxID=29924 RepID=A0A8H4BMI3_MUCCL|nr:hypothetical protein FB192DRAFT_1050919 [Mucor lusitanicus]
MSKSIHCVEITLISLCGSFTLIKSMYSTPEHIDLAFHLYIFIFSVVVMTQGSILLLQPARCPAIKKSLCFRFRYS